MLNARCVFGDDFQHCLRHKLGSSSRSSMAMLAEGSPVAGRQPRHAAFEKLHPAESGGCEFVREGGRLTVDHRSVRTRLDRPLPKALDEKPSGEAAFPTR